MQLFNFLGQIDYLFFEVQDFVTVCRMHLMSTHYISQFKDLLIKFFPHGMNFLVHFSINQQMLTFQFKLVLVYSVRHIVFQIIKSLIEVRLQPEQSGLKLVIDGPVSSRRVQLRTIKHLDRLRSEYARLLGAQFCSLVKAVDHVDVRKQGLGRLRRHVLQPEVLKARLVSVQSERHVAGANHCGRWVLKSVRWRHENLAVVLEWVPFDGLPLEFEGDSRFRHASVLGIVAPTLLEQGRFLRPCLPLVLRRPRHRASVARTVRLLRPLQGPELWHDHVAILLVDALLESQPVLETHAAVGKANLPEALVDWTANLY